jgi:hypothetical protein
LLLAVCANEPHMIVVMKAKIASASITSIIVKPDDARLVIV